MSFLKRANKRLSLLTLVRVAIENPTCDSHNQHLYNAYIVAVKKDPCSYCGHGFLKHGTLDHIKAKALNGSNGWNNKTKACKRCNHEKQAKKLILYMIWRRDGRRF